MEKVILAAVILAVVFLVAYFVFGRNSIAPTHHDAERFASLLISEIKLYNDQKWQKAFEDGKVYASFKSEIEEARIKYKKRILETNQQSRFDDALVKILADGDRSKLGTIPNSTNR